MNIRPFTPDDLRNIEDIDGTARSETYLHINAAGDFPALALSMEQRPLKQVWADRNRLGDRAFTFKQVVSGIEEGFALAAEHDDELVGAVVAQVRADVGTMHLVDLRVDFDYRRQGIGSALLFGVISEARNRELRAVSAETLTSNVPAAQFLHKCGMELAGWDTRRYTNHDLVKETVALFWYLALD